MGDSEPGSCCNHVVVLTSITNTAKHATWASRMAAISAQVWLLKRSVAVCAALDVSMRVSFFSLLARLQGTSQASTLKSS